MMDAEKTETPKHPTLYVVTRTEEPDRGSMCVHPEEFDYEFWSFDREELERIVHLLNSRDTDGYDPDDEDIPRVWEVTTLPHVQESHEFQYLKNGEV